MGSVKKMFEKVKRRNELTAQGRGSQSITGIAPGDRGSNTGQSSNNRRRLPGRREPRTVMGPGGNQM